MATTIRASRTSAANVSPTARPTDCDDDVTAPAAVVITDDVDGLRHKRQITNDKHNSALQEAEGRHYTLYKYLT